MKISLYRAFGGYGGGETVALVGSGGTFEIPPLAPGRYYLRIGTPPQRPDTLGSEFADRWLDVGDRDLEGLALVVGPGASITGRVVVEPGAAIPSAVGLLVKASAVTDDLIFTELVTAGVAPDWSFHMTGLSGTYRFYTSADRPPNVAATRVLMNGAETPATSGVELVDGVNEVVVYVTPREPPKTGIDATLSPQALIDAFKNEASAFRQLQIAEAIVKRHDAAVLPALEEWLNRDDRHVRGNAAFVFAGLGDARGFTVITGMLTDRTERGRGLISGGNWTLPAQIRSDRYYAVHLLGLLHDPRAVAVLVPLLRDADLFESRPRESTFNVKVVWALREIGDRAAIGPLIETLGDPDASIRVSAIYALETLHATEAIPGLTSLLNDEGRSRIGAQVRVGDAAADAIAKLR